MERASLLVRLRKDLDLAADELAVKANAWFGPNTPFHIVAHSMGGLVARTFIKRHTARWKSMWDGRSNHKGTEGGRLVMLGTPNHGSYLIPQVITGLSSTIRKIERVDVWHDLASILQVVNSFVGSFQMLPSPLEDKEAEPLYRTETYGDLKIPGALLDIARTHHEELREVIDPDRLTYVAGANQATISGIKNYSDLRKPEAYTATFQGDGSVTHKLGLLKEVKATYYVAEEHSALTSNLKVLEALDDLLSGVKPPGLATAPPASRGLDDGEAWKQRQETEAEELVQVGEAAAAADAERRPGARPERTPGAGPGRRSRWAGGSAPPARPGRPSRGLGRTRRLRSSASSATPNAASRNSWPASSSAPAATSGILVFGRRRTLSSPSASRSAWSTAGSSKISGLTRATRPSMRSPSATT